jgi:partner of Y14 and mago protein
VLVALLHNIHLEIRHFHHPVMSGPASQKAANSGIQRLSNGSSVIPSSTRADGSVRKEIKVKPGYKPPEDVELYRNRTAAAWKNRGKGGVPGAESLQKETDESAATAAANKNAKRREARKKAATAKEGEEDTVEGSKPAAQPKVEELDPEAEKAKEAKKLAKKLRQARELSDKKEKGEGLLPEQFAKVIKMNELIRQLDGLGFDAEGERKSSVEESKSDKPVESKSKT